MPGPLNRRLPARTRRVVALAALALAVSTVGAQAHAASTRTAAGNPLAGHPMGIYTSTTDDNKIYQAYLAATGADRQVLARLALRPRAQWFIGNNNDRIQTLVQRYIANTTGGDPNVIAPMVAFGIPKWEAPIAQRHFTPAVVATYHDWVDKVARGIGGARVMMVLQPDLIYATNNDYSTAAPMAMVRYAAKVFGALPHTTVYLDAGARDFVPRNKAFTMVGLLRSSGIQYVRGFSLNDTHHDSTNSEIAYGNGLAAQLARAGLPHHFVVNTSSNGRPSTVATLKTTGDAPACTSLKQTRCVALGLPPTTATSAPYWGITAANKAIAQRLVDAFVWVDRPWMTDQGGSASVGTARAITLGRVTPFVAFTPKSPTTPVELGSSATTVTKDVTVRNASTTQNMTIDKVWFTSSNGVGRWSAATASTCTQGAIVAPGRSCVAHLVFTPVRRGVATAWLHIATNTANPVVRALRATSTV